MSHTAGGPDASPQLALPRICCSLFGRSVERGIAGRTWPEQRGSRMGLRSCAQSGLASRVGRAGERAGARLRARAGWWTSAECVEECRAPTARRAPGARALGGLEHGAGPRRSW